MSNTERVYGLVLRWQAALGRRNFKMEWNLSEATQSINHLVEHFPDTPALEIMDWLAGTIENGDGPSTFGDMACVASPMELVRSDYRGFRMVAALCPIRC